ncbi:hypothetical protein GCM10008179_21490 [Hansschlegelia plantiphila]|uniref:Uncharacterized protein n=1 Tax=Hansschlegelia plantiphila TaxID=374655 RepID=A0A9W6J2D0_9HYPH|nr:hypothetical protein GCM10008179_21490 [Hansschlegelia plantiphila]
MTAIRAGRAIGWDHMASFCVGPARRAVIYVKAIDQIAPPRLKLTPLYASRPRASAPVSISAAFHGLRGASDFEITPPATGS